MKENYLVYLKKKHAYLVDEILKKENTEKLFKELVNVEYLIYKHGKKS